MKNKKIFDIIVVSTILIFMILIMVLKGSEGEKGSKPTEKGFELLATSDFDKMEVISRGYPTLLDIGGEDCMACKSMKPILEEVNELWQGKIIVKFIDYWKYPHLAEQFNFKVIPTQYFYDEYGNLYTTHEGTITKKEIINIFKEMGYSFDE